MCLIRQIGNFSKIKCVILHTIVIALLILYRDGFCCACRVTLLLGDHYTKITLQAIRSVSRVSELKSVQFDTYTTKTIGKANLQSLRASDLVIIQVMDRTIQKELEQDLSQVLERGGKVFVVGGLYDDELRRLGYEYDSQVEKYYRWGGVDNIENMLRYVANTYLGIQVPYEEPIFTPEAGIYDPRSKKILQNFDDFVSSYKPRPGRPWVGVFFYKNLIECKDSGYLDYLITALEENGFNALPVFGYPSEDAIKRFFMDEKGSSRISILIAVALKVGVVPDSLRTLMDSMGVPVINAITLYSQSEREWRSSPLGLDIFERMWQIGVPELAGIIQSTIIASKEMVFDEQSKEYYVENVAIPERIKMLINRVKAWHKLQHKQNKDKRVAIIYYNYPPGKNNIGAAYLNLPDSLYTVLKRLKDQGYDTGDLPITREQLFLEIQEYGRNIGNWAPAEIHRLAISGKAELIPLETYQNWFNELPEGFRDQVTRTWGNAGESNIMTWQDKEGKKYFVIPVVRYGNLVLTPQPSKGWEQDVEKLYHDTGLPPHHQYIAFYLWLRHGLGADAVIHFGTHGTHEWLCGREVGFTEEDPPEVLISDLPNIYPYLVDNVGEGIQAKRRGHAVIIDHMTPPFEKGSLNRELRDLLSLINDYAVTKEKSPIVAEAKLKEIDALAKKMGVNKDLGITEIRDDHIEKLEHHLKEIQEQNIPLGLHTFGRPPEERLVESTADIIASIRDGLSEEEKKAFRKDIETRILYSPKRELDSLTKALEGKYILPGKGNDPIRNPDSLPTGKNFYSFDGTRIPTRSTYEAGKKLAEELLKDYKEKEGHYPQKLTFNLWAVETIRHEGIMESQIMALLGVKPVWDPFDRVVEVEIVPREELKRPRVDVVVLPSGLYRDVFPNLMALLDKAVYLASSQEEPENLVRQNTHRTKALLLERGFDPKEAELLACIRIFAEPPGAYGTNLDKVISMSHTWEHEKEVANVFLNKLGYLYGRGLWGERPIKRDEGDKDAGVFLLKNALSGTDLVMHSASSNLIATLDNDDYFSHQGGTALAIRSLDGKTPKVYLSNLSNPLRSGQEPIERYMGRELRARYLNPQWIQAMLKEGYAGARFVDQVVENLWGWQVTVPEAVGPEKWREFYETYVLDKYQLDIKGLFKRAANLWAYQSIVARMLEVIRKGYWNPEKAVKDTLAKEFVGAVEEVGLACCDHTCNNPMLSEYIQNLLISVPGLEPRAKIFEDALKIMKGGEAFKVRDTKAAQGPEGKQSSAPGEKEARYVEGYVVEEVAPSPSSAPIPYLFLLGFLLALGLVLAGFKRKQKY